MQKFKIVCLDIDGTLLNSDHQITSVTKETIQIVTREKEIPVVLVSARMPKGIVSLQQELGISQPMICYSGALILDRHSEILAKTYIRQELVQQVLPVLQEENIHISLYKDDEWYVEAIDQWAHQEKEITGIEPIVGSLREVMKHWQADDGCNKILCIGEPEQIQCVKEKLSKHFEADLTIYLSKPTYLEIMPKTASKTSAISHLLKSYNFDKSECIAMGDNYNDVDMLQFAGLGVAMGNAPEEVKRAADTITLSNDEDGVAVAIKKYVL